MPATTRSWCSSQALVSRPPPKPVRLPSLPIDAMARQDHRDRVAAVGGTDRPCLAGVAEAAGLLAVADRGAERDRRQPLPRRALERRAARVERHVERRPVAGEVLLELTAGGASTG